MEKLSGGEQPSLYAQLTQETIRRHRRIRSHVVEGKREAYTIDDAAQDVMAGCKLSPTEIFSGLIKEAKTTPKEVDDSIGFYGPTWTDFLQRTSLDILWNDIYMTHPEISQTDDRRTEYWTARSQPQAD